MFETSLSSDLSTTALHRVSGRIKAQQAAHGAAAALRYVADLSDQHGLIDLILDLRGMQFEDLAAHRAWSQGFARNPALGAYVRNVAIVGDDTPAFRAEQELMSTERVNFFVDVAAAEEWLANSGS